MFIALRYVIIHNFLNYIVIPTWNNLAANFNPSSLSNDCDAATELCKAAILNNTQTFSYANVLIAKNMK